VKKKQSATFSDIVSNEKARTPSNSRPRVPERAGPLWRDLTIVEEEITPEQAQALVQAGAAIGWDDCGSRDFAESLTWLQDDDVQCLRSSKPPQVRRGGSLVKCRLPDGRLAVVAEMDVRWGSVL
jgi:hypothetical protein